MPKETFFHLSQEKQRRIMKAAKKEFSRVPLTEASIAQIIKDAEIPRGSFYQYFEDKEDLYFYYFQSMKRNSQKELNQALKQAHGSLFDAFEIYFTKLAKEVLQGSDAPFYKNLFMHMDYRSFHKVVPQMGHRPCAGVEHERLHQESMRDFYDMIDLSSLKVANQAELKILIKMLMHIVFSTVAEGYKQLSGDQDFDSETVISVFTLKLNWLKSGASKESPQNSSR